jgi:putative membrane protein insertion efficiency factor
MRTIGQIGATIAGTTLRGAIRAYQLFLSPVLGSNCRFRPTCSQYAIEAIELHGPLKGSWLALRRIARCHPWGGMGYDPVPAPRRCDHDHNHHAGAAPGPEA